MSSLCCPAQSVQAPCSPGAARYVREHMSLQESPGKLNADGGSLAGARPKPAPGSEPGGLLAGAEDNCGPDHGPPRATIEGRLERLNHFSVLGDLEEADYRSLRNEPPAQLRDRVPPEATRPRARRGAANSCRHHLERGDTQENEGGSSRCRSRASPGGWRWSPGGAGRAQSSLPDPAAGNEHSLSQTKAHA